MTAPPRGLTRSAGKGCGRLLLLPPRRLPRSTLGSARVGDALFSRAKVPAAASVEGFPRTRQRVAASGKSHASSTFVRKQHARCVASQSEPARPYITIPSARWVKVGRSLADRLAKSLHFQHRSSTLNSLSIPEKVSLADPRLGVSTLFSVDRRLSSGGSTPTCVCVFVCVCAGRKSVEHGRAH
jgi:hypothetical protein